MKIELSKRTKMIVYPAIVVIAFLVGMLLEHCDKEEFTIKSVPNTTTAPDAATDWQSSYDEEGRLDINMATREELIELNGIGEKTAEKIISYRNENGNFDAVEELTLIGGIGDSLLQKIRDEICVR